MEEIITIRSFNEINIKDPFFRSLIEDYPEFPAWFQHKGQSGAEAYVQYKDDASLQGFLYMKDESDCTGTLHYVQWRKRFERSSYAKI